MRLRERLDADQSARARLVLDHDRLAQALREHRPDFARDQVRGVAGRERHDDADRPGRPGLGAGGGGTQTLPRIIGERRAKELILAAKPFTAEQAHAWGVVNEVCEPDELMPKTLAIAQRIAENAPLSVRQAKHSIHRGLQMDIDSAMLFEIEAYQRMVRSEDRVEGVRAFNEKRKPVFKGR